MKPIPPKRAPISDQSIRSESSDTAAPYEAHESNDQKDRRKFLNIFLTKEDPLVRLVQLIAEQAARECFA